MPPTTMPEQLRRDIAAAIKFLQAVSTIFPGQVSSELLGALAAAEEHPLLLDLLAKALSAIK